MVLVLQHGGVSGGDDATRGENSPSATNTPSGGGKEGQNTRRGMPEIDAIARNDAEEEMLRALVSDGC